MYQPKSTIHLQCSRGRIMRSKRQPSHSLSFTPTWTIKIPRLPYQSIKNRMVLCKRQGPEQPKIRLFWPIAPASFLTKTIDGYIGFIVNQRITRISSGFPPSDAFSLFDFLISLAICRLTSPPLPLCL